MANILKKIDFLINTFSDKPPPELICFFCDADLINLSESAKQYVCSKCRSKYNNDIYYCPSGAIPVHPLGFNLCLKCVESQLKTKKKYFQSSLIINNDNDDHKSNRKYKYKIGDVVLVKLSKKLNTATTLARIKAVDVQNNELLSLLDDDIKLDDNSIFYGIEYFNYKPVPVPTNDDNNDANNAICDGYINGIKIFSVKKQGYGAFILNNKIISKQWSNTKTNKLMKLKKFDNKIFMKAAKYGLINVIKYMMKMKDYSHNPTIIRFSDKYQTGLRHSAWCTSIYYNHIDVVKLFIKKYSKTNQKSVKNIQNNSININSKLAQFSKQKKNEDVINGINSKNGQILFYNHLLFDRLCRDSNVVMLELLLSSCLWPIYYYKSKGLYHVVKTGKLEIFKLLLLYINDLNVLNYPLVFDTKHRTLIPQTTLNILNCSIVHKRLNIIEYLITNCKYNNILIKNRVIYNDNPDIDNIDKPHILPTLLFCILDCHYNDRESINFTIECIELLTKYCDPCDIGLNWYCNKQLNLQKNTLIGKYWKDNQKQVIINQNILFINRALMIGTLLSGLTYKSLILWQHWNSYDVENIKLKIGMEKLIRILVENGIDWNISKYNCNIRNIFIQYQTLTDMDIDTCNDVDFVIFFRETVSKTIQNYRNKWLNAFKKFYRDNKLMINIFKYYVLDFVVPRDNVLDEIKYFTIKPVPKEEEKSDKNDNNSDDNSDNPDFDDPLGTSFGVLRY